MNGLSVVIFLVMIAKAASAIPSPRTNFKERIIKGEEATPHAFPYQAYLKLYLKEGGLGACGGSLISPTSVLTAAHCVDEAKRVTVILGLHDVTENDSSAISLSSNHFIIHRLYNPFVIYNDIAIVILPEPVKLNENIAVISLPTKHDLFIGQIATASGWGRTSPDGTLSNKLRYYTNKVITNSECMQSMPVNALYHICVSGQGGKSACKGDSGGPLTTSIDGKVILIGIASFVHMDCDSGYPTVFTRVTSYLDWIASGNAIKHVAVRPRLIVIFIFWVFLF